jgi:sirohydrochlorin cobaltochelatase
MPAALILFAHGARDARWAEPFQRILARVQHMAPERAPMLAFLELMTPDLATAIATQASRGFDEVRIVPLFLGQGGHLREDLPVLIERIRSAHPGLAIIVAGAAGEDDDVIDALASYCVKQGG